MPQWGATADSANSVKYGVELATGGATGAGAANIAANNTTFYANLTSDSFVGKQVAGQFATVAAEMANTSGERNAITASGWQVRRAGEGPIVSVTAVNGANVANGETVTVSNGSVNATLTLITNATANLAGATVSVGGTFVNGSVQVYTFTREQHVTKVTAAGGSITGYANTDVINMSNGIINGVASVLTNSTGGFVTANITISNPGLFANNVANNTVVVTIVAANGAASNGTGATLTANLITSTAGTISAPVLGGRAGRVHYECIVAMNSITGAGVGVPT